METFSCGKNLWQSFIQGEILLPNKSWKIRFICFFFIIFLKENNHENRKSVFVKVPETTLRKRKTNLGDKSKPHH